MRPLSPFASAPLSLLLTLSILLSNIAYAAEANHGLRVEVTKAVACIRKTRNGDVVSMNYRGTLESNGKEFDSSYGLLREPFTFTLGAGEVIEGWDQGLLDMCIGEKRRLTIPPELGYGHRGAGTAIPPDATLGMLGIASLA